MMPSAGKHKKICHRDQPGERRPFFGFYNWPSSGFDTTPSVCLMWQTRTPTIGLTSALSTAALTPHQRREAVQRLANGEAQADVARSFNVSQATISRLAAPSPFEASVVAA
jgi:hypothetical protein